MRNLDSIFGRLGNRLFQCAYVYAQMKRGLIKDIFVQDYRYFDEYREDIQNLFGDGIGHLPYVSIHVRRGKNPVNPNEPAYSENPYYVDLTKTDYYEKAIALFPDKKFLVFSDDPEFCRQYFKGDRFQIIEKGNEITDFNTAASCSSHIIANSSFSFWYAYTCPHPDKKVVAPSPKLWYSSGNETQTVLPEDWIKI